MQVTGHEGDAALHGNSYTLTCTVTLISGITLPVTMEWIYNNVSIIPSDHLLVNKENTSSLVTTLHLTFAPIETTSGGDYTCRASVHVPWMDQQPPVISESVHIPVTSKYHKKFWFELESLKNFHSSSTSNISAKDWSSSVLCQLAGNF